MSENTTDVDSALLAAAGVLPAHFADTDDLRLETLDAIQATTMSLPGGAIAVETNLQNAGNIGSVVMVVTGLVDHSKGEVFDRTEARSLWTAALTEALTALGGEIGEFKNGQINMADAFDALEKADESNVVGVFNGDTLAALLLALPKTSTGQGAAAELAAAIAAAEAAESGEDADGEGEGEGAEGADAADGADASETADATEGDEAADEPLAAPAAAGAAAGQAPGVPGAEGLPPGFMPPGMMPGYPGAPAVADPYAAYYGVPAYPGPGAPPQMSPEEAAAFAAQAAAARAAAQPATSAPQFHPLYGGMMMAADPRRIELLRDVVMGVSVELGRTQLTVQEILGLTPGSIVELDRAAGAPVDVLVNGTLIAHGEVVVVDEEFAVRISEVVGREGRLPV
ncbi:MAG: flagellar motor switch protein FliN [Dermatophilus congolensis]|nr:flagellar motor switch protein FliN [Dermatophilus congolensis]